MDLACGLTPPAERVCERGGCSGEMGWDEEGVDGHTRWVAVWGDGDGARLRGSCWVPVLGTAW